MKKWVKHTNINKIDWFTRKKLLHRKTRSQNVSYFSHFIFWLGTRQSGLLKSTLSKPQMILIKKKLRLQLEVSFIQVVIVIVDVNIISKYRYNMCFEEIVILFFFCIFLPINWLFWKLPLAFLLINISVPSRVNIVLISHPNQQRISLQMG